MLFRSVLRLLRLCGDGEVTALGEVLLTLLLAELDIELIAVATKLLGLECVFGLEILGSVFRDSFHGGDGAYVDCMLGRGGWDGRKQRKEKGSSR